MLRVFRYLKGHIRGNLKFNTGYPSPPESVTDKTYEEVNWTPTYPEAHKKLPQFMPKPMGKPVQIWTEFDANHAFDLETRWSVTGVLIYLNHTVMKW